MTMPTAPGTCSYIATALDAHFVEDVRGATILRPHWPGVPLPNPRPGIAVAQELAGRLLMRFLKPDQTGAFTKGSTWRHYVTPTPYTPEEAVIWLNLPESQVPRTHLLFLDPAEIPLVVGPMWVAWSRGIQYILPEGFPEAAIVVPGAPTGRWETRVT